MILLEAWSSSSSSSVVRPLAKLMVAETACVWILTRASPAIILMRTGTSSVWYFFWALGASSVRSKARQERPA